MDRNLARERLVTWLKDIHAVESALETCIEKQVNHAQHDALLRERLEQHRDETRNHAALVERALDRYGEEPSTIKDAGGRAETMVGEWIHGAAGDTLIKDVLLGVAAEHYEIACYRALKSAAAALGDEETAVMCDRIIDDEIDMAKFLESQLGRVTEMELEAA